MLLPGGPAKTIQQLSPVVPVPAGDTVPRICSWHSRSSATAQSWGVHTAGHGGCELLPSLDGPSPEHGQAANPSVPSSAAPCPTPAAPASAPRCLDSKNPS